MELRKPPPIRRLTGNEAYSPEVQASPPPPGIAPRAAGSNGNGHRPSSAFAMPARRAVRDSSIAIDRMHVDELSVAYGTKPAVKSVSLPIRQGEVLALIGPSGCGKTTLLRSLNRLTELTRGASFSRGGSPWTESTSRPSSRPRSAAG